MGAQSVEPHEINDTRLKTPKWAGGNKQHTQGQTTRLLRGWIMWYKETEMQHFNQKSQQILLRYKHVKLDLLTIRNDRFRRSPPSKQLLVQFLNSQREFNYLLSVWSASPVRIFINAHWEAAFNLHVAASRASHSFFLFFATLSNLVSLCLLLCLKSRTQNMARNAGNHVPGAIAVSMG